MKPTLLIFPLMLLSLAAFADADAVKTVAANAIVTKTSPYSVAETMNKFESIVKAKGLDVFARIDHQQNAKAAGMEMNAAQVLIFGNPKAGTALMQQDMAAALDLPMRVAVYADKAGDVQIAYHAPDSLAVNYGLKDSAVLPQLTDALNKLTAAAIATAP
ncbi:DUF302 domain-containing protein [Thiothrix subterranea]|uniref:DUF302 domain-containing protein n=2 Tax=Thiothrix subterranea TaxID=2735563 RepID=A0AA51MQW1_9GAMM|nr:DUF302 domain-containing protein [Thiothrix subterranea]MDQ5770366.1 DUF302 domain-containing protein [Thiothrix subterranea]WML86807.1 DUF302 domain-containing protein [Thiothrix subterranea]